MISVYDTRGKHRTWSQEDYRFHAIDRMFNDSGLKVSKENLEAIERLYEAGYRKGRQRGGF